jgi:DNA-binding YbaB/EbfC family protein
MTSEEGGGFDLSAMLRRAQKMTEDMSSRHEELAARQYEGSAGGGVVRAAVVGGKVQSISIDPAVTADVEMLSDLVMAAINNALAAASSDYEAAMAELKGGLDLGGLLG